MEAPTNPTELSDFSVLLDQVQNAFTPNENAASQNPSSDVDLTQIIHIMEARAAQTLAATRSVLSSHHPQFTSGLQCAQELSSQVKALQANFAEIANDLAEEDASLPNVQAQLEEAKRLSLQKVDRLRILVDGLKKLAEMHDQMSAFDDAFHASKVLTAARLLLDFDTKIVSLKNNLPPDASAPYNSSLLLRALRAQFARDKARLLTKLTSLWQSCVNFKRVDRSHLEVTSEVFGTQADGATVLVPIGDVGMALSALDGLRLRLQESFATQLWAILCEPIIQDPLARVLKRTSGQSALVSVLEIIPSSSAAASAATTEDVWKSVGIQGLQSALESLLVTLRFIENHVLDGNKEWMGLLRKHVWDAEDALGDALLSALRTVVAAAADDTSAEGLEEALGSSRRFEQELVDMGLLLPESLRLTPFIRDIHKHVAKERKISLLTSTREGIRQEWLSSLFVDAYKALGSEESESEEKVAIDIGLRLPSMRVSVCAKRLVENLEKSKEDRELQLEIARDCITLFQALVPHIHKDRISADPRAAAILHNDCLFLAHHLLLSTVKAPGNICLVHLIPSIRKLGDDTFNRAFTHSVSRIEATSSVASFSVSGAAPGEVLRRMDAFIIELFKPCDVLNEWKQVLPEPLRKTAATALVSRALHVLLQTMFQGRPASSFSSNDLISLRVQLREGLKKATALIDIDAETVEHTKVEQICSALDETTTLHIMRDKVADGKLSALDARDIDGLCGFLFASESPSTYRA